MSAQVAESWFLATFVAASAEEKASSCSDAFADCGGPVAVLPQHRRSVSRASVNRMPRDAKRSSGASESFRPGSCTLRRHSHIIGKNDDDVGMIVAGSAATESSTMPHAMVTRQQGKSRIAASRMFRFGQRFGAFSSVPCLPKPLG